MSDIVSKAFDEYVRAVEADEAKQQLTLHRRSCDICADGRYGWRGLCTAGKTLFKKYIAMTMDKLGAMAIKEEMEQDE